MKKNQIAACYLLVFFIWSITVIAKYKYNGLILGLDYGLYHPDGTLYTMRALDWAGYNEQQAASIVSNWYNAHAFKFNDNQPSNFFYTNNPKWSEYYPRVLYPFLSIPFVKIFGVPGMLVIPAMSLLIVMLVILYVGIKKNQIVFASLLIFLISGSITVNRWMMANTTDALFVGLFSLTIYFLLNLSNKFNWFFGIGNLIILTGLTRMSFLFWVAVAIVMFVEKRFFKSFYILLMGFIMFIPALLSNSKNSFLPVEGNQTLGERILLLPKYFLKITYYESAQLFVLDRLLFFIIVGAISAAFIWKKESHNKYYIVLLLAGLTTGTLNGTVGVNFRYQLPIVAFACWSIIENFSLRSKNFHKN
jgi:hypothetical protein